MSLKRFVNITPAELKQKGVVALADKPNVVSPYGAGGMSSTALKLWFDQIGKFIVGFFISGFVLIHPFFCIVFAQVR